MQCIRLAFDKVKSACSENFMSARIMMDLGEERKNVSSSCLGEIINDFTVQFSLIGSSIY